MAVLGFSLLEKYLEVFLSRKRCLDGRCDRFSDRFEERSFGGATAVAETRCEFADRCAEWSGNARLHLELALLQHGLDGT